MENLLILVNIILAIVLIIVILLQRSEGGALGLGVSQDNFTSTRSVGTFLTKFTSIIAALFIMIAIGISFANRIPANEFVDQMMVGAATVTSGALIIGLAASIEVILSQAQVVDTIVNTLSALIVNLPTAAAAVIASCIQGIINLFVPSGSGQALITMPILIPLADLSNMSRQLMITAFQVGDGLTNLIVPTSGGTLAMLALGRVSYKQWLKAIIPFMIAIYILCWIALVIGHYMGY